MISSLRKIEIKDFFEQDFNILMRTQDPANGNGDFSGRDSRSRDLVEKRLKRVMIATIDQRDLHLQLGEASRGGQAAEPSADNDEPRTAMWVVWLRSSCLTIPAGAVL